MKIIALALTACCACVSPSAKAGVGGQPPAVPDGTTQTDGDTLRGLVRVVGAEPTSFVVLWREPGDGVRLLGPLVPSLRSVAGLEIQVQGRVGYGEMRVERFRVRAASGLPAVDGVLAVVGDTVVLHTTDGPLRRLPKVPPRLRELVGERVWLAGAADREPELFGRIAPAR